MKSIGHEETFAADLHTHAELARELVRLADAVAARLRAHGTAARTLTLKVRFAGFETITRSITVAGGVVDGACDRRRRRAAAAGHRSVARRAPARRQHQQLRVRLPAAQPRRPARPSAVDDEHQWRLAEETVDAIRKRFGTTAIGPASAVGDQGLAARPPGRAAVGAGLSGQA